MKTTNNVQKAITKSLAVVVSLVLLSITVNAQEFWQSVLRNNSFTQIALAMATETPGPSHYTATYTKDVNMFSEMFKPEAEPALSLESWMTSETRFSGVSGMLQPEAEPALNLESWMMNEKTFGVKTLKIEQETETALQMEEWMTDSKVWKK